MRIAVLAAAVSLSIIGLSQAGDARAAMRLDTNIPPENLGTALKSFAQGRNLQILYFSDAVRDVHTGGAVGQLTTDEALTQLLSGTGLTFRYVSDKAITILPASTTSGTGGTSTPAAPGPSPPTTSADQKEGKTSSSGAFLLAQAASGQAAGTAAVATGKSDAGQSEEARGVLQEVIVTATKRSERLIDVPLAITAVTAADIAERGITNLQDMQYAIPGLTIADTGIGLSRLELNGIASQGGASGLPVVAVYLDEMPVNAESYQPDVRLIDIERVEVLHGPQPTLYGDGAMGGTIRYITASPNLDAFSGYADGQWGTVADGSASYRGTAVLNAPLVDGMLGLRVAAGYEKDGGWVDSLLTGRKDVNDTDIETYRAKLLFRPLDALSVSLMVMHEEHNQSYQNFGALDRTTVQNASPNNSTDDFANLIVSYNLGPATLLSSTGYMRDRYTIGIDLTSLFLPILPFFYPPNVVSTINSIALDQPYTDHEFVQELRLSSNGSGPFNYIVGANFRRYRYDGQSTTSEAPGTLPPPGLLNVYANDNTFNSWAVFGELRYSFTQRLEALIGLRHFEERQSPLIAENDVLSTPNVLDGQATFVSNNPRFNLSYKTGDNGLVYFNAAKGFRSGVFNITIPNAPPTAGPETLWTYTVGEKQDWLDHRLSTDLSVYYNQWTNMQENIGAPLFYVTNTGKASGPGVNFALQAKPLTQLTVSATVGYNDMKHDVTTGAFNEGDPVDLVDKWSTSAALEYRQPVMQVGSIFARIEDMYTSGYPLKGTVGVDSRNLVNARFGLDLGRGQLYIFGTNLTDNNTPTYPQGGAYLEPILPTPRTVGVGGKVLF